MYQVCWEVPTWPQASMKCLWKNARIIKSYSPWWKHCAKTSVPYFFVDCCGSSNSVQFNSVLFIYQQITTAVASSHLYADYFKRRWEKHRLAQFAVTTVGKGLSSKFCCVIAAYRTSHKKSQASKLRISGPPYKTQQQSLAQKWKRVTSISVDDHG